jgi:hypothetical protein
MNRFRAGDEVLLRFLRHKPGDLIVPARVVHDGDDYIALYTAVGTPGKCQAMRDGTRITRDTPFEVRERLVGGFADFIWHTNHSLLLHVPGRMSVISLFFRDPDLELVAYYGNIQAPLKRTAHGFDTADYLLDVWINPDLTWEWKDEDEWQIAREHGFIEPDLLDEVRREGERIIADVESQSWPFNAGFESWRRDPAWTVPELPAHWAHDLEYDPAPIPVEAD